MTKCACGCGQETNEGRKFIFSHHLKTIEYRRPRGPNKKRKYRKRDRKYWEHKRDNEKITAYSMIVERELESTVSKVSNIAERLTNLELSVEKIREFHEWNRNSLTELSEKYDKLNELLSGEQEIKVKMKLM